VTLLHMGALHGLELPFVVLLCLGPMIAVVGVVLVIRRRDELAERDEASALVPASPRNTRPDERNS
jgi:hypothetical protein